MRIEYLLQQREMAVAMLPREMSVAMLAAADEGMGAETHSEVSCLLIIRAICKLPLMSKSQGLTLQSSDTLRRWRPTREREREREKREREEEEEGRRAALFLLHKCCSSPFSFSFFSFS